MPLLSRFSICGYSNMSNKEFGLSSLHSLIYAVMVIKSCRELVQSCL